MSFDLARDSLSLARTSSHSADTMRKREPKRKAGKKPADETNGVADEEKTPSDGGDEEERDAASDEGDAEDAPADLENGEQEPKKRRVEKRKAGKQDDEEDEDGDEDASYEVETVLDEKKIKGVRHFLIRWKGYTAESDTWEPESTLDCSDLIKEFQAKPKKGKKSGAGRKPGSSKKKWNENEQFEVDRILNMNTKRNGKREFLVSWKGYPASQNSWEPEENMECVDLIKKYLAASKSKGVKPSQIKSAGRGRPPKKAATPGRRPTKKAKGK